METYTEELIEEYEYYEEDERIQYKDSTYDIVSKVAYLIGVPKKIFENEHEPPKIEIYEVLDKDKSARIVRNLCIVRAAIERNFGKINDKMRKEFKSIYTLPEYVPQDALRQLELDSVNFYKKSSTKLGHHIIEINTRQGYAVVEPGVITADLQEALAQFDYSRQKQFVHCQIWI